MLHRYDLWKNRVDRFLTEILGLDSDSLEDWPWYDIFKQGELPRIAALEFALEQGFITEDQYEDRAGPDYGHKSCI
jgi:hypothetical protein